MREQRSVVVVAADDILSAGVDRAQEQQRRRLLWWWRIDTAADVDSIVGGDSMAGAVVPKRESCVYTFEMALKFSLIPGGVAVTA